MDALVSKAAMILLSLHPGPASETSAFKRMRAFSSRRAGPLPLCSSICSCSRSCALSRTAYFFTAISLPAMIASAARIATKANHPILSNWLKRATRSVYSNPVGGGDPMTLLERASVCTLDCPDTCSLTVTVADGRIVKVRGSDALPYTEGVICTKVAHNSNAFVHGPNRLLHPLRRTGLRGSGEFVRVSWEEAL